MEEELFETDASSSLKDKAKDDTVDTKAGTLVSYVMGRFEEAEDARMIDEERWLMSYRNYRGLYGPETQFTETEKSRVFVKITKTKVLAAYGQIVDVLFANNTYPLTVDPTSLPEGVADTVHMETNPQAEQGIDQLRDAFGKKPPRAPLFGPNTELQPGDTVYSIERRLGGMKDQLAPVMEKLIEGPSPSPTAVTFHPAMIAAKKMQKKIMDQLEESNANKQLRLAAFDCALFGTGIMKGPFAINKEYPSWDEDGTYNPIIKTVPSTAYVSVWNFYPDPDAANMDEAEFVIERHKMSRSQLRALKRRPYFRSNAIDSAIERGESYERKYWEMAMEDDRAHDKAERFEVYEYWGYVDTEVLKEHDIDIPRDLRDLDQLSVNAWVCNGQVLRLVMNPFKPSIIPYFAAPYEVNPYSFFGVGIAENMTDTQQLMNGFMRMAVDNAVLSGNLIFEVDETNLVPGQDMTLYPGKIFRRQGGAPGQALFSTKFQNVTGELMQLFDKARVLADESTGFPSFAHGQTGVSGVGRTASGISMLMSAANGSIRTVIKNIDDYLIAPLGKALFSFNMQFDYDPEIKGDLEVKAQGTESLMANEVRSQRLMQFLGVVSNPVLAPFAKMDYIVREIAKSMDLDPDKLTNSLADAAVQAEILKQFVQPAPQPPEAAGGPPGVPAPAAAGQPPQGAGVADMTGGGAGNIGVGAAARPGEAGFSGNIQ